MDRTLVAGLGVAIVAAVASASLALTCGLGLLTAFAIYSLSGSTTLLLHALLLDEGMSHGQPAPPPVG